MSSPNWPFSDDEEDDPCLVDMMDRFEGRKKNVGYFSLDKQAFFNYFSLFCDSDAWAFPHDEDAQLVEAARPYDQGYVEFFSGLSCRLPHHSLLLHCRANRVGGVIDSVHFTFQDCLAASVTTAF